MSSILKFATKRLPINRNYYLKWKGVKLNSTSSFNIGDKLHGYTVQSVTQSTDFDLEAIQLSHDLTKAQHLHINRDDTNNVFGVGFRTVPMDSTGICHILEHTTLCGSEHYPVRDPFFKMLTRSMATFMNAYTANDWTLYPFSTQNSTDYRNLLSIYLDCVFYPNLRYMDFSQEGWRLEHELPTDKTTPLMFKGVVFNEMKGMFSNSDYVFGSELQSRLLPSHTYSYNSGGIPIHILDLTWDALKQFHAKFYHPSNARFYTYGTFPLETHLEYINNTILSKFSQAPPTTQIPYETRWTTPRIANIDCPPDPMAPDPSKQTTVGVAYLCGNSTDPYDELVNDILSKLLIDGPASPFYQSLLEDNKLGADYSPSTGLNSYTKDTYFSVGLQGMSSTDVEKVRDIIKGTFHKVVQEGFSERRINAILNQVEISLKHQSTNFGLNLLVELMSSWIHDADITSFLSVNEHVEKFKSEIASDPKYLQKQVEEKFLNNEHQLTLVMSPNDKYNEIHKEQEDQKLHKLVNSLSSEDKESIYNNGLLLLEDQNKIQNSDCLPSLSVSDVNKDTVITSLIHEDHDSTPIQYCTVPTNGVTYMKLLSSLNELPQDLRLYVPLFCAVITKLGTHDMNYKELSEEIDLYTNGLSVATHLSSHHTDVNYLEQCVSFSSHCLDRHLPYMLSLWEDIFNKPHLQDQERLRTLIAMLASSLATTLSSSGHSYAMTASKSYLNPLGIINEEFNGITQLMFLKSLAEQDNLETVLQKLASIAVHVLDTGCMRCSFNMTQDSYTQTSTAVEGFLDNLPGSANEIPIFMTEQTLNPAHNSTHYELPFSVYYTGLSVNTVPYSHTHSPLLQVLAQVMSWKYLHQEIREKGGAYGGGARHGNGTFSFFSYRDPNSLETIDKFNSSIEWAVGGAFTEQDVEEAKLSVLAQIDTPVSPGYRGSGYFSSGITDEMKQQYRDRIFNTYKSDLLSVVNKYLKESEVKGTVIIGPQINELPSHWTVKNMSL